MVPKECFSWCWLVCWVKFVSCDQNNKDSWQFRKALTFQTKTNVLHHYKGILLVKLFWQNQNYQLVLGGSQDRDLVHCLRGRGRLLQWPRSLGINLIDSHPNLVVNSYGQTRGLSGQPGGLSGQPGGLSCQPGGLSGQPGGLSDQPGGLSGKPGGLSGQPWGYLANLEGYLANLEGYLANLEVI